MKTFFMIAIFFTLVAIGNVLYDIREHIAGTCIPKVQGESPCK